jgi:hypothetical protein
MAGDAGPLLEQGFSLLRQSFLRGLGRLAL